MMVKLAQVLPSASSGHLSSKVHEGLGNNIKFIKRVVVILGRHTHPKGIHHTAIMKSQAFLSHNPDTCACPHAYTILCIPEIHYARGPPGSDTIYFGFIYS